MKIIALLASLTIAVSGCFLFQQAPVENPADNSPEQANTNTVDDSGSATDDGTTDDGSAAGTGEAADDSDSMVDEGIVDTAVKTFSVSGTNFAFDVKEIRVKKGDRVRINFTSASGFHDWVLDEFDARTTQLTDGDSDAVEFVADKTGTFEYYCSVGKHREMGMVGNLIVE